MMLQGIQHSYFYSSPAGIFTLDVEGGSIRKEGFLPCLYLACSALEQIYQTLHISVASVTLNLYFNCEYLGFSVTPWRNGNTWPVLTTVDH